LELGALIPTEAFQSPFPNSEIPMETAGIGQITVARFASVGYNRSMTPSVVGTSRPRGTLRARAFSLIEMLISMAIIIILFTMMYGFGSRNHQMNQRKVCQSNLLKIYIGLQIYGNDYADRFPVVTNAQTAEEVFEVLVPRYTADTGIYVCPGSKDKPLAPGISLRKGRVSYSYYMGWGAANADKVLLTDKQVNATPKLAGDLIFSEDGKKPGNNHHKYGGNLLFADGSVKTSPARAAFAIPQPTNVVLLNPKP
jgi:prepilin-type N-terminal cleavage/methylation domain-containing protein/prepilin-type processing-associated H-X9-DG protein